MTCTSLPAARVSKVEKSTPGPLRTLTRCRERISPKTIGVRVAVGVGVKVGGGAVGLGVGEGGVVGLGGGVDVGRAVGLGVGEGGVVGVGSAAGLPHPASISDRTSAAAQSLLNEKAGALCKVES